MAAIKHLYMENIFSYNFDVREKLMIYPFYYPTLPGLEQEYMNWVTIFDACALECMVAKMVPESYKYESKGAQKFPCYINATVSTFAIYSQEPKAVFPIDGTAYFNAFLVYDAATGKLLLFNKLDTTFFVQDGDLEFCFSKAILNFDTIEAI